MCLVVHVCGCERERELLKDRDYEDDAERIKIRREKIRSDRDNTKQER